MEKINSTTPIEEPSYNRFLKVETEEHYNKKFGSKEVILEREVILEELS